MTDEQFKKAEELKAKINCLKKQVSTASWMASKSVASRTFYIHAEGMDGITVDKELWKAVSGIVHSHLLIQLSNLEKEFRAL
jgi:hypothetical protein